VGRQATDTQEDIKVSEFAFPVTEDVEEISRFLGKAGPKVVFCTYQSSALIAEAQSARNTEPFDLAIADEAHRCAGDKAGAFATILDSGLIRTDKRLFTTATPRIYASTVTKRAKERGIEVVGMDDPKVFGTELHRLTFGEAINRDLLTDYQVVIVGVDEPMIAEWIDQAELLQVNPDMATDARSLASKIALIKAIRDFNMTRVISFHSRVKAAELFSNEVGDIIALVPEEDRPTGEMWSDYVSGEMQTSERTRKIGKLKALGQGQLGILTNARCLSEGVDVPALDGIAFIDPRASQVDIIQAVGRALRHSGITGKKVGTIILPVFIEPGDDPEEQIGASAFKPVWEVLKALRAHDDLLADALDSYRTEMGRKGTAKAETKPDKIVFDLPQSVGASFSDALKTKLVEQTTTSWNFSFGLLEVYYAREGHCAVPMSHEELGYSLGGWVANQRRRKAKLSNAQILRLENLGFSWNSHTEAWDEGFRKLQQFHAREGHCLVPKAHIEDGFSLAGWVSKQRKKRHNLTPEKVKRLEALNFVWEPLKKIWDTRYNTLLQFHAREGHCLVPQAHIEDGFALGSWVATQRVRKASMLSEQIDQLNQIGFAWSAFEANWDEGFGKLLQFHAREGHCLVPRAHIEDGFALGKWVGTKRARKASMSSEQIDQLNQIGFAWNALEANWDEGFGKLLQFHAREGHCRVPLSHTEDGFRLGRWVSSQRGVLKKGKLCSERCEKLHALGFVRKSTRADTLKDRYQQNWDKAFSKLENFYKREGHCRVPTVHKEDGLKLGQWVRNQRANAKKGKLADERYARLNALGFVWDGTLTH
jgi:superfamily II DNA or RNA helicase